MSTLEFYSMNGKKLLKVSELKYDTVIFWFDYKWNFFFFKIYFNWRLITLQNCGGFCHASTSISHGVHVSTHPPPSPPHLSGLSQSTGFECPASCIELALVIYFTYGNGHVSMLFSSPSPTEFKRLFYTSLSLLLSLNRFTLKAIKSPGLEINSSIWRVCLGCGQVSSCLSFPTGKSFGKVHLAQTPAEDLGYREESCENHWRGERCLLKNTLSCFSTHF